MAVGKLGTKRRLECMLPIEAVVGTIGSKSGEKYKYDPDRYGTVAKMVGYQKAWSPTNRFAVRVKKMEISTANLPAVTAHRTKFRTVAGLTHERKTNPATLQMDQAAFKAQTKYATFWGFLFHLEWESYEG